MTSTATGGSSRLDSVDFVRGAVMILMLLDHTRDFVHETGLFGDPLNPATTTPLLYFTRWVSHLCAPAFVLLAGLGVGLRRQRGASESDQRHFLWTRGLWLMALEVFVFRYLIWLNVDVSFLAHLQVIWSIGISMLVLSLLVRLPVGAIAVIGALIVVGHNLLDGVRVPPWTGPTSPVPSITGKLWMMAHQGGFFPIAGYPSPIVWVNYPVLPWIGIMALGYAMSEMYSWTPSRRQRALVATSIGMAVLFIALRASNVYGDPRPWASHPTLTATVMDFMNVQKYPPSLLFTLATLAPSLFVLARLDGRHLTGIAATVVTFGRVPMFFYIGQWLVAHLMGIVVTAVQGGDLTPAFVNVLDLFTLQRPAIWGGPLWVVYVCWLVGVLLLYWPCRWFARVKATRREWWLQYL